MIEIRLRDINGKRIYLEFHTEAYLCGYDWSWFDDENYEILSVIWNKCCIYNALTNEEICLEDILGFFA